MNLLSLLALTPIWVYGLFAYLLWIGFKSSKTRIISIKKLAIMPIIFTALSAHTLVTAFALTAHSIGAWLTGILVGSCLGYAMTCKKAISAQPEQHTLELPGSWSTLCIILVIFFTKYYFDFQLGMDPAKANQTGFEYSMLIICGLTTGLFIGRFVVYLSRLRKAKDKKST